MRRKLILIAPLAILGLLAFMAVGGFIVQWLWNWLMPALFGVRTVTFWQALALLALCRILFGGFGGHRGTRGGWRRRMGDRLADRFERMSPEERERFRQRVRERCGFDVPGGAKPASS